MTSESKPAGFLKELRGPQVVRNKYRGRVLCVREKCLRKGDKTLKSQGMGSNGRLRELIPILKEILLWV